MAKQITVNCSLTLTGDGANITLGKTIQSTQVGNNGGVQTFTTSNSGALIPVGGLTTYGGYFAIINNDAAITIGIYQDGATATVKMFDLLAGQMAVLPIAAAPGCKAASGTPDLIIMALEP